MENDLDERQTGVYLRKKVSTVNNVDTMILVVAELMP